MNSQISFSLEWFLQQSGVFSQAFDCGPIVCLAHWQRQSWDGHPSPWVAGAGGTGVVLTVAALNFLVACEPSELGWWISPGDDAFQLNFLPGCRNDAAVFPLRVSHSLDYDVIGTFWRKKKQRKNSIAIESWNKTT